MWRGINQKENKCRPVLVELHKGSLSIQMSINSKLNDLIPLLKVFIVKTTIQSVLSGALCLIL